MERPQTFEKSWFLTAGETDAQGRMPITAVGARAIEIATLHANALGIGFSNLAEHHLGWVLARFSIEMLKYPDVNDTYSMTTWIEGFNRFFSDRCFEMTNSKGETIAHIRSVWVAIDIETRKMADLTKLNSENFPVAARECPVEKCRTPQIAPDAPTESAEYTFTFSDIDFNRHVNTLRYLEKAINLRTLDFHDHNTIRRLDASFDHECHYGDKVTLVTGASRRDPKAQTTEFIKADGQRAVSVELLFDAD